MNPFQVVKDFEAALCEYTGAPYCVTTTSCTMALLLAVAWSLREQPELVHFHGHAEQEWWPDSRIIEIPKRTYVSVPMSIIHAGGRPTFRDEEWTGAYRLKPLEVWDAARMFTAGMYQHVYERYENGRFVIRPRTMVCVSFHWNKILGIQQGGAILTGDEGAADWLRRARFDGRTEGVAPKDDTFDLIGWHCYMSPEVAAQ